MELIATISTLLSTVYRPWGWPSKATDWLYVNQSYRNLLLSTSHKQNGTCMGGARISTCLFHYMHKIVWRKMQNIKLQQLYKQDDESGCFMHAWYSLISCLTICSLHWTDWWPRLCNQLSPVLLSSGHLFFTWKCRPWLHRQISLSFITSMEKDSF